MSSEVRFNKLNVGREKVFTVQKQAKKCLNERVVISNANGNLSEQFFKDAPTLYMNPTENMIISNLVVRDKAFATVLGSGDFAIDASFQGARKILTFDINGNQYYPAALKLKGFQNMSYTDFWNFFSNTGSDDYLSQGVYDKLKKISDKDSLLYAFFDEIVSQRERDISNIKRYTYPTLGVPFDMLKAMGGLFRPEAFSYAILDMVIRQRNCRYKSSVVFDTISGLQGTKTKGSYLESEETYREAQKSIQNSEFSFVKSDVANLKTNLDLCGYTSGSDFEKFQAIYLSNVPEYIDGEVFYRTVIEQLSPLLEDDGVIAYCCQATDKETLAISEAELAKRKASMPSLDGRNFFSVLPEKQLINLTEGLHYLKGEYNIDFSETSTLSSDNGNDKNDTYIYLTKKRTLG